MLQIEHAFCITLQNGGLHDRIEGGDQLVVGHARRPDGRVDVAAGVLGGRGKEGMVRACKKSRKKNRITQNRLRECQKWVRKRWAIHHP